jgi:predicted alpha/beta superfamily hydrolase
MPRRVSIGPIRDPLLYDTFLLPNGLAPRRVRVHVPVRGPTVKGQRPALFLFDGQNVLDDAGSFAGGWWAHRAVDRLAVSGRRAPVVVAIDHGGEARIDELSPFRDSKGRGGLLEPLLEWIVGTLVPRIQKDFNTIRGPYGSAIGGSSMGGLASLWAHHRFPEIFGGALSMSPSLWFANRAVFDDLAARPRPPISRIWLDCGTREAGGRMVHVVAAMVKMLAERGYDADQLRFLADPRGGHDEASWRRRLPRALRFMYR